jgi:HK97 gp10 family phage protein
MLLRDPIADDHGCQRRGHNDMGNSMARMGGDHAAYRKGILPRRSTPDGHHSPNHDALPIRLPADLENLQSRNLLLPSGTSTEPEHGRGMDGSALQGGRLMGMKPVVTCQVVGVDLVMKAMHDLGDRKTKNALRAGFKKAARRFREVARSKLVPGHGYETGLLKKSLDFKVYTSPNGSVGAVIGPGKAFKKGVVKGKRGKLRVMRKKEIAAGIKETEMRTPINYAHLVEYGHKMRSGGTVEPRPFLRPAFEATKGEAITIVETELRNALIKNG